MSTDSKSKASKGELGTSQNGKGDQTGEQD